MLCQVWYLRTIGSTNNLPPGVNRTTLKLNWASHRNGDINRYDKFISRGFNFQISWSCFVTVEGADSFHPLNLYVYNLATIYLECLKLYWLTIQFKIYTKGISVANSYPLSNTKVNSRTILFHCSSSYLLYYTFLSGTEIFATVLQLLQTTHIQQT